VSVAALAANFRADHAVTLIDDLGDVCGIERLVEARPTCSRFEFRIGLEQRQAAQAAGVRARLLVVQQRAAKRWLRALIQQDATLFRIQRRRQFSASRGAQWPQVIAAR
jgi:hypothetical protein